MTITPQTDRRDLRTEIDLSLWLQEWEKKGSFDSPLWNGTVAREACVQMWEYLYEHGECAELYLALAGHEHTWGTAADSVLRRGDTRSLINARTVRHPKIKAELYFDPKRDSSYVKYRNVMDSLKDAVYRFNEPGYSYDGVWPLGDFIKVLAPREDSNDPEGYTWWVANYINGLRSRMENPLPGGDLPLVLWYPADLNHYERGRAGVEWPDTIIVHHTDGFDSLWWLSRSPNSRVSAHYLMNHDGSPRAQLVRHADTAWTTGYMNPRAISIEWERYWTDAERRQYEEFVPTSVYEKLGRHVADIVRSERLRGNPNFDTFATSQLKDHNDFYSTVCPGNLDMEILFQVARNFLNRSEVTPPGTTYFKSTGKYAYGGFRGLYLELMQKDPSLWARLMGPPRSNEGWGIIRGEAQRMQRWQKAWTVWNQNLDPPYNITFMNLDDVNVIEDFKEEEVV